MNRRDILKAMAASMAVSAAPSAFAQNWAGKQFRFVVGYPAGGVIDFTARTIAEGLHQQTGATVLVENKAGAASNIAMEFVAKQSGESGVFGIFGNSTFSTNAFVPQLSSKSADPYKELKPVAAIADMILILAVTEQLGVKNLDEFLAKAKASPTPLRVGLAGIGSPHHLAALLLERSAELNLNMVPYKGGAPMIADAAGGHLDAVFTTVPVGGPMVASGKLRWIAIAQPTTIADLPGIPSLVKVYKGASIPSWIGIYAPSGTADSLIATMHDSINRVVAIPAISAKLRKNGLEPITQTLAQTQQLIAEEAIFMKKFLSEFKLDFSA